MGGKDPNREPRLRSLRHTPLGWIRLATCTRCLHKGPLPVDRLVARYGELAMVEFVLFRLKCTACGNLGASATMMKLCEPGCHRQRG